MSVITCCDLKIALKHKPLHITDYAPTKRGMWFEADGVTKSNDDVRVRWFFEDHETTDWHKIDSVVYMGRSAESFDEIRKHSFI